MISDVISFFVSKNIFGISFRGLNFSRWKFFVGGNFRRWKCFAGGNLSSVEMFRRWKFRHLAKFSSLSTDEIFADKVSLQKHNFMTIDLTRAPVNERHRQNFSRFYFPTNTI